MAVVQLEEDIAAMGYAPVTATSPTGVVVIVDSSLVPVAAGVSCDGPGVELLEVCGRPILTPVAALANHTVLVVFRTVGREDWLMLEIVPGTGAEAPIARTFVRFENDAAPDDVPLACERARSPRLDLTGTLTINGLDITNVSATHGHMVLDLPGGGHATVDF